jgi:hypothetical protein
MASGKLEHLETCREVAVPEESNREQESSVSDAEGKTDIRVGLAVALAALAAVGAGIAIQQIYERRLSKPEMARLDFIAICGEGAPRLIMRVRCLLGALVVVALLASSRQVLGSRSQRTTALA